MSIVLHFKEWLIAFFYIKKIKDSVSYEKFKTLKYAWNRVLAVSQPRFFIDVILIIKHAFQPLPHFNNVILNICGGISVQSYCLKKL